MYPVPQTAILALWLRSLFWRFKLPAPDHRRIRSLVRRILKSRQNVTDLPFVDSQILRRIFRARLQVEEADECSIHFCIVKRDFVCGLVAFPEVRRGWLLDYFGRDARVLR